MLENKAKNKNGSEKTTTKSTDRGDKVNSTAASQVGEPQVVDCHQVIN